METKITKIETYIVRDKLSQSFYFSQWKYSERCICLVKITCSNGQYVYFVKDTDLHQF